jgi:hypothetical protein
LPAQLPKRSHADGMSVGQAAPGPQGLQESPQAFPTQSGWGGQSGTGRPSGRHAPEASHVPACDGTMQGGVAARQGGSIVQGSPQAFPAHAATAPHRSPVSATQRPCGSHAFTTAVSAQSVAPGGQAVQVSPQAFPAQASYAGKRSQAPRDAATPSRARRTIRTRMAPPWGPQDEVRPKDTPCGGGGRWPPRRGRSERGAAPGRPPAGWRALVYSADSWRGALRTSSTRSSARSALSFFMRRRMRSRFRLERWSTNIVP